MSREDRIERIRQMYIPEEREPNYEAPFSFDPQAADLGAVNALRMIGNAPYSAIKNAGAMVDAGADVMKVGIALTQHLVGMEPSYNIDETVPGMMVRGIAGTGEIAGNASGIEFLAGEETQNAKVARAIGEYFTDMIRNPGRHLVEDPMGAFLDLSAIGGPATRMAKVGASIRAAHPVRAAATGIKQGAKFGNWMGEGASKFTAGFLTGFETPHFKQMIEAGRSRPVPVRDPFSGEVTTLNRRPASIAALREQVGAENVINQFRDAIDRLTLQRRAKYQEGFSNLKLKKDATLQIEPTRTAILNKLFGNFDSGGYNVSFSFDKSGNRILNFTGSSIGEGENVSRNVIQKLVRELDRYNGLTLYELDAFKKRVGQLHRNSNEASISNSLVDETYGLVRKELGKKVVGYDELTGDYEFLSKKLKEFKSVLSAQSENPETVLNKLTGILKDSPTAALREGVMDELVRLGGGRSIIDQVAGLSLSQRAPKGLLGRSALARVVGGGVAAGGAYAGDLSTILGGIAFMGMTSPRVMGEFFSAMGVTQRQADNVVRFMEELDRRVPNAIEDGLTVGGAYKKALLISEDWSHMTAEQELLDAERARRKAERVSRETRNRPPIGGGGIVEGAGATVSGVNIR